MNQFKVQLVQNGPNGLKCIALDWMVWMDWSGLKCYIDVAQKEYNKFPPQKKEYNNNKYYISILIYYIDFLNKFSKRENLKMLLWVIFF